MSERKLRVLVVDDDPLQLELVDRSLRHGGFDTRTTDRAFGATNIVRAFSPDVILLDVDIPALSGDRLLRLLRQGGAAEATIILYSAHDEGRLRRIASDAGADGWVSKSTPVGELAGRIRSLWARKLGPELADG